MKKSEQQLNQEYDWGMQILLYINSHMMNSGKLYKTLPEVVQHYAEGKSEYSQGPQHYLQTINDLMAIAEHELDSWKTISNAAYVSLEGPEDAKKWLLEEVLPPLIAEAEKRGWKKPASVGG